jgi:hypothetical protein
MVATTLYLNGFSKHSAFRQNYDKAILKELDNVRSKYETKAVAAPLRRRRTHRPGIQSWYGVSQAAQVTANEIASMPKVPAELGHTMRGDTEDEGMLPADNTNVGHRLTSSKDSGFWIEEPK